MNGAGRVVANSPVGKPYWAMLLIATLCVSNYLALFNEDFRQIFVGKPVPGEPPPPTASGLEKAQLVMTAALLGVSVVEVAEKVKGLKDQHKNLTTEKGELLVHLGNAKKEHQELSIKHTALEQRYIDLDRRTKVAAKTLSTRVAARAGNGVARHVASAAGESIPVVGTALIAGMLALDVMDACYLLKEVNEMNRAIGVDIENEGKVCGIRVPTENELAFAVTSNWKQTYLKAAEAIGKPRTVLNVSWKDLKASVCAVLENPVTVC